MADEIKKLPPYSVEAEQSVLGALLIDNDAVYKVIEIVQPQDFYRPEHVEIMKAIKDLALNNIPVDMVSVTDKLQAYGSLDSVGGPSYIAQLATFVPNSANVEYYAKIVKHKSILRQLINAGAEISEIGFNETLDIDEAIDLAEQKIFNIYQSRVHNDFVMLKDFIYDHFEKIETRFKKKMGVAGVPSGYPTLDKITGGFQNSDLIIIAARPSVGKTSLALNIATNIAIKNNIPVGFFSLEMSKEQLLERMLSSEGKVDMQRIKTGYLTEDDFTKLSEAYSVLYEAPIYIDDSPENTLTDIRTKSRRLKMEANVGILFIDYLQLIKSETRVENRVVEVSEITRGLKNLARELNIPVVVLSQLNRSVEKREDKRPMLSDLRESGSIEQDADVVMFLHIPDKKQKDKVELIVAKQRNGPQDDVKLKFLPEYTKFAEMSDMKDEDIDF